MNITLERNSSAVRTEAAEARSPIQSDMESLPAGSSTRDVTRKMRIMQTDLISGTGQQQNQKNHACDADPAPYAPDAGNDHLQRIRRKSPTKGIRLSMEYRAVFIRRSSADFVIIP